MSTVRNNWSEALERYQPAMLESGRNRSTLWTYATGAVAEGFMAGLVLCGYSGPWRWAHHQWEGSFYRAWRDWTPAQRHPDRFPRFELGGHGRSSQGRDMLWQLKSTSPFHDHQTNALTTEPRGLSPREYLEIWVDEATPDEWQALARSFLQEMRLLDDR